MSYLQFRKHSMLCAISNIPLILLQILQILSKKSVLGPAALSGPDFFHRQEKRKSHFALQRNGFSLVSFFKSTEA
jgi:hypothetical protein